MSKQSEIEQCPKCGNSTTKKTTYRGPMGVEEYTIKCTNCGYVKEHWAYGMLYIVDWKDRYEQSHKEDQDE